MSLGYDYDMVLLLPRAPFDSDPSPCRQRHRRRLSHHGHHSRRTHHAWRMRESPRPCSRTGGNSPSSPESSCSATGIGSLARDLSGMDLATGKAPMAQCASVGQCSEGPSRSMGSTSVTGGPMAATSPFPHGLDNAATSYSRSMRSTMSSYVGLPKHHLRATLELLATTSVTSSTDSTEDSDGWAGANFSRLHNPEGLR
jgi:hypothetical protein